MLQNILKQAEFIFVYILDPIKSGNKVQSKVDSDIVLLEILKGSTAIYLRCAQKILGGTFLNKN